MQSMTCRERWLAAIHLRPVDRLPFWPKLDGAYPRARQDPFAGSDVPALHRWIGSDPHVGLSATFRECRTRTGTRVEVEDGRRRTRFETPHGALERVDHFAGASQSWHPVRMPVRRREDIGILLAWFEDCRIEADAAAAAGARTRSREIGETASTMAGIGESPLMEWVEWIAGVENAHLLLEDCRPEVEALFAAMHEVLLRKAEVMCETCPADLLYMIENTSTTLISPEQYRHYCLPHVQAYAAVARSAGRSLALHMCGHLRDLLPDLAQVPAHAFEAFTSPPVGNTTLADGRRACPEVCLIGGTNAALWTRPVAEIIAELESHLDALPHHRGIVVTSAGVMPPCATPETIKAVCDWVKGYRVSGQ